MVVQWLAKPCCLLLVAGYGDPFLVDEAVWVEFICSLPVFVNFLSVTEFLPHPKVILLRANDSFFLVLYCRDLSLSFTCKRPSQ